MHIKFGIFVIELIADIMNLCMQGAGMVDLS